MGSRKLFNIKYLQIAKIPILNPGYLKGMDPATFPLKRSLNTPPGHSLKLDPFPQNRSSYEWNSIRARRHRGPAQGGVPGGGVGKLDESNLRVTFDITDAGLILGLLA